MGIIKRLIRETCCFLIGQENWWPAEILYHLQMLVMIANISTVDQSVT